MPPELATQLAAYRARPDVAPLLAVHGARARGSIVAFEQTRLRTPDDPFVLYVLGTLYAEDRRTLGVAVERYAEAVRLQSGFARDETLQRDAVRALLSSPRPSAVAGALVDGPLAPMAGPELLDAVMNARAGAARNRATAALLAPAYNAFADDTVRGLIALSRARTCEDRLAAVRQLARAGDRRAVPYLRRIRTGNGCGILGLEACNGCLGDAVPDAVAAIESRGN
jgi:hypothetical protein